MWYANYGGRSIGRVLHFLECLQGFGMMEYSTIGNSSIEYHGETAATYVWTDTPESKDVPKFTFTDKYHLSPTMYMWKEKIAILSGRVGQAKHELERIEREHNDHKSHVDLVRKIYQASPLSKEAQDDIDLHEREMARLQPMIDEAHAALNFAKEREWDYVQVECNPPTT